MWVRGWWRGGAVQAARAGACLPAAQPWALPPCAPLAQQQGCTRATVGWAGGGGGCKLGLLGKAAAWIKALETDDDPAHGAATEQWWHRLGSDSCCCCPSVPARRSMWRLHVGRCPASHYNASFLPFFLPPFWAPLNLKVYCCVCPPVRHPVELVGGSVGVLPCGDPGERASPTRALLSAHPVFCMYL